LIERTEILVKVAILESRKMIPDIEITFISPNILSISGIKYFLKLWIN